MMLLAWLLCLCSPIHFQLYSQAQQLKFNHLSQEQGLSQNAVYAITQDFRGFMWFGTEDGLNRYDGCRFIFFKTDPTDPHSLSDNVVYSLCEDGSHILWVGTRGGGLDKFNRETYTFTHYRNNPNNPNSLSQNCVNTICAPPQHPGELWIGTQSGGIDKFEPENERFTHYRYDPDNPYSPGSNNISQIHEDRSGKLWVATNGGGLNKFDRESNQFIRFAFNSLDPDSTYFKNVFAICEDRSGLLWIGTDGGILKFNPVTEQFTGYILKLSIENVPGNLGDNRVRVIREDRRGVIWIGTLGGLNMLTPSTGQLICTKANSSFDPDGLSDNDIWSIYESRDGVLWIGTEGGGMNTLDLEGKPFIHYRRNIENTLSLNNNEVWSFCGSNKKPWLTWIGTKGGGLNEFNRQTGLFKYYLHNPKNPKSLGSNSVYAILEDREGKLWIGTDNAGLSHFDFKKGFFTNYIHNPKDSRSLSNNCIWALCEDNHGNIWIGTEGGGLDRFDPRKKIFSHFTPKPGDSSSISSYHIWSLHKDKKGTIWIGTADGLNRFNRETETFTHYTNDTNNPNSLGDNHILCLYTDHAGNLWIGTQGGGLNKFNREIGTFSRYTEKNGLPNNVIYGILEENKPGSDGPCLWLSTNNGLSRFNPLTGKVKNYTKSDGLQANEFNAGAFYKNEKGEMFFGGINGFNVFDPCDIHDNHYIPPVVITGLDVLHHEALPGKVIAGMIILQNSITETTEIILSYRHDVLTFEFATLHYASPSDNQYAYRLEGLEKEWNYSGNRHSVTYSQIPPGNYVFYVKASNADGIWNEEGTSLKVSITPPPWKTWWFRITVAISIGIIIYLLYRLRTQNIKSYEKELEKLVVERTQELNVKKNELEKLNNIKNKLLLDLRIANKRLEELSRIDGLTGIANRRIFDETLESEWKRCRRNKVHIAMLMMDVDYFKLYNDTHGHQMGDMCLKSIGVILSFHISRPGDLAARYGGEEFAAILVDTDLEGARIKAEDIRKRVMNLGIPHGSSTASDVMTVSIGVASMIPTDENGYNELMKAADDALYKAKNKGRNCVCLPG